MWASSKQKSGAVVYYTYTFLHINSRAVYQAQAHPYRFSESDWTALDLRWQPGLVSPPSGLTSIWPIPVLTFSYWMMKSHIVVRSIDSSQTTEHYSYGLLHVASFPDFQPYKHMHSQILGQIRSNFFKKRFRAFSTPLSRMTIHTESAASHKKWLLG